MTNTEQLNDLIREAYRQRDEVSAIEVSPNDLATEVYGLIDPRENAPELVTWAALLELRHLARAICRRRQTEDKQRIEEQHTLFDYELQRRYPATRNGRETYVLRNELTIEERHENAARLRSEGRAKVAHADALDAETRLLIGTGNLQEAVTQ